MANFCTKCGRKLIDGQPCICTQQQETQQEQSQQEQTYQEQQTGAQQPQGEYEEEVIYEGPVYAEETSDVTSQAKNFFIQAVEMIKHPSTGFAKAVSNKDNKNGLILMGIEAILAGIYMYVLVQKIVAATLGGGNSLFGTSGSTTQMPSLGQFFGYGVLVMIIASLVISGLVMGLMNTMGKVHMNWFQACQIAGIRSLGVSMGWILGILGLFLGMYQFAILIIAVGGVLGFIYMLTALMSYPEVKKDAVAYITLIAYIIAVFVTYFVIKEFFLSSLLNSVGGSSSFLSNIL